MKVTFRSITGKTIEKDFKKNEEIPTVIPESIPYGSDEQFFYRQDAK